MNNLDLNLDKIKGLLTSTNCDLTLCTNHLKCCLSNNKHRKVLKKLIKQGFFDLSNFWKINFQSFTNNILPQGVKIILIGIQHYETEFSKFQSFIKNLTKYELIQICASDIEKYNQLLKHQSKWLVKNMNSSHDNLEADRQTRIASAIGFGISNLLKRKLAFLPSKGYYEKQVTTEEQNSIRSCINSLIEIDSLQELLEYYVAGYCNLTVLSDTEVKVIPKEGIGESIFLSQGIARFKDRAMIRVSDMQIDPSLILKIKFALGFEVIDKIKELEQGSKEKDRYLRAKAILEESQEIFFNEYLLFKSRYSSGEMPKTLPLSNGEEINVLTFFKVVAYLRALSVNYYEIIGTQWEENINQQMLLLEVENWEMRTAQKELSRLNNDRGRIEDKIDELYRKGEFPKYIEQSINNTNLKIEDKVCLHTYEKNDLLDFMSLGLEIAPEEIEKVIDLLKFNPESNNLIYFPFIEEDNYLYWIPSSVAYNVFGETLALLAINNEDLEIHREQTNLYEGQLSTLFKHFGYKTIIKAEDKYIYNSDGSLLSDFDTLAYKDGHLFHFEVKTTNFRQSPIDKEKWYKDKLYNSAGKKQIPKQRNYIEQNPESIKKILKLGDEEEIRKIHSYLISNSSDYDNLTIKGYLKTSFSSLVILLTNLEFFLYDELEYCRLIINRILLSRDAETVPPIIREWASRKVKLSENMTKKMKALVAKYASSEVSRFKTDPAYLAECIENDRFFNHINDLHEIYYKEKIFGKYKVHRPIVFLRE